MKIIINPGNLSEAVIHSNLSRVNDKVINSKLKVLHSWTTSLQKIYIVEGASWSDLFCIMSEIKTRTRKKTKNLYYYYYTPKVNPLKRGRKKKDEKEFGAAILDSDNSH